MVMTGYNDGSHIANLPVSGDLGGYRETINKLLAELENPRKPGELSPEELEDRAAYLHNTLEELYEKYMSFMILRNRFEFPSELLIASINVLNKLIDDAVKLLQEERLSPGSRNSLSGTLLYLKTEDQISGLRFISCEISIPEIDEGRNDQKTCGNEPLAVPEICDASQDSNEICGRIRKLDDFFSSVRKNLPKNETVARQEENAFADGRRHKRLQIIAWCVVLPLFIFCFAHLIAEYAEIWF